MQAQQCSCRRMPAMALWVGDGHDGVHALQQIVPTVYVSAHNRTINSNQYSVTEHFRVSQDLMGQSQLPGVFFFYDLSPIKVPPLPRPALEISLQVVISACMGRASAVGTAWHMQCLHPDAHDALAASH